MFRLCSAVPTLLLVTFAVGCPTPMAKNGSTPANAPAKATAEVRTPKASCEAASLALDAEQTIATVDGEDIKAKDLGPEYMAAERKALEAYCGAVSEARSRALEAHVIEALVEKRAKAEGITVDAYVKARVDAATATPPTDEEARAFFMANSNAEAPPFDAVKPQVIAAMQRDKAREAIDKMVEEVRKGVVVVEKLPDVRPPAADLSAAPHTPVSGKADSTVVVTEFADFECPYCSVAAQTMTTLKSKYGDRVAFQFRHFPLSFHPNAKRAAEYAQCANEQGRFWEMHDQVFKDTKNLGEEALLASATSVGVDATKLTACLESGRAAKQVEQDLAKGKEVGVQGTPSFFINGRQYSGNPTPEAIGAAIEKELSNS